MQTTKAGITPGPYGFRHHVQRGGHDMLKAREIGLINACRIYSGGLMMLFRKFALASGFIFPLLSPVSAQVASDGMGGFRSISPDGSIRHYSSDGMGGFRSVSPNGSITHYSSDGAGGFKSVSPDGSIKHYSGDGMGGLQVCRPGRLHNTLLQRRGGRRNGRQAGRVQHAFLQRRVGRLKATGLMAQLDLAMPDGSASAANGCAMCAR